MSGTVQASTSSTPKFTEYSLAAGKSCVVYQVMGAWALSIADVLWASPDGATLIGSVYARTALPGDGPGTSYLNAGVITKGTFKPLRFPLVGGSPFAGEIAF